jgi:hypothetical protein
VWHFRQSIDYSMTANRAGDGPLASRYRVTKNLYRIYQMGKDEFSGQMRSLDVHAASRVEKIAAWDVRRAALQRPLIVAAAMRSPGRGGAGGRGAGGRRWRIVGGCWLAEACRATRLHRITVEGKRDPRGFIMPSDLRPDFGTTVRFVNALIKSGIHRASRDGAVHRWPASSIPANSLVIKTAQSFRPHVMDMFEPQDHPDDIPYPGATPTRPYDNAGYTLAFQMGVQFDRILDGFDGPFEKLTDFAKVRPGQISGPQQVAGLLLQPQGERQLHRDESAARVQRGRVVVLRMVRWGRARSSSRTNRRPAPHLQKSRRISA